MFSIGRLVGIVIIIMLCPIEFIGARVSFKKNKKLNAQLNGSLKRKIKRPVPKMFNFSRVSIEDLGDNLALDTMDYPTSQALKLLVERFWPQLGDVTIEQECGGSYTGIIFSASHVVDGSLKKVFFLKISRKNAYSVWQNLQKVQESKIGQLYGCQSSSSPIITSVEKFFIYKDMDGTSYTIEVTHAAKGKSVGELLLDNVPSAEKNHCALAVGAALGFFHQKFMIYGNGVLPETWRTFTHGDFHPGNIFFHKTNDFSRVFFIDNETMAKSLDNPQAIDDDVIYFFFFLTDKDAFLIEQSDLVWQDYAAFLHHFIKGYCTSFMRTRRESIICYLQDSINKRIKESLTFITDTGEAPVDAQNAITRKRLEMLLIVDQDLPWYVLPERKSRASGALLK